VGQIIGQMWILVLSEMAGNSNLPKIVSLKFFQTKMNNSYTLIVRLVHGHFTCGEEESLEKKVERIIGQMWVPPYQFILDIEQLRWGVTMHQ
jgi:hypothetical protein